MIKKSAIALFDWTAFAIIIFILITGVLTIYSATYMNTGGNTAPLYLKQIGWIITGMLFLFAGASIDYQTISKYAYPLYALSLILLILVMFIGSSGFGAQRWLSIGGLTFQPSELAKLATALALTRYFSDYPARYGYTVKELLFPGGLIAVPVLLVLKQPDLGTGLIITFVSLILIYLVRVRSRFFGFSTLLVLMLFPFAWHILWENLKEYQKTRLLTFINPAADPTGTGYHVIQSKIAIGSGGFWGKGILESTQSHLNFLPARHTDFVFAVFAEEWGFFGVLVLLLLYVALISWGFDVALKARDRLGMLMASGIISIFALYCAINIGMTIGIVPVVGIPLPFMSYGGTSLITTLFSLGILFNIKKKRYLFS
ncbi:MAG: rod shape-determining protein RodA [Nitrospirae bacterium]|nr:rod shape-determining protein RodA [Nitrospirota bacterium]